MTVERRDSNFQGVYEQLPWPVREWAIRSHDGSGQVLHDELVAADAPAFIGFDQAAAEFFGVPPRPNRNFSGRELVVRQQDRRARFDRVRVHPTELLIDVTGEELRGVSLTLSGFGGASHKLSPRAREIRLPIPDGLGPGAWLALHRDQELLDRRVLDPAWGVRDVDVVVDSATRVELLVSGGERETVEFKRQLPGDDPTGVMKTVAAFANGAGGTILFGVENDGEIVGVRDDRDRDGRDRLTSLVSDWVRPLPDFQCEWVEDHGVIALRVEPGDHVPYGVGTSERGLRYYIRRAGSTFPAAPADVRAFVQSRLPPAPGPYLPH
ncbi:MAG: helix-turn-helix domain-containing protein [Solirubrobacterales bacterium]